MVRRNLPVPASLAENRGLFRAAVDEIVQFHRGQPDVIFRFKFCDDLLNRIRLHVASRAAEPQGGRRIRERLNQVLMGGARLLAQMVLQTDVIKRVAGNFQRYLQLTLPQRFHVQAGPVIKDHLTACGRHVRVGNQGDGGAAQCDDVAALGFHRVPHARIGRVVVGDLHALDAGHVRNGNRELWRANPVGFHVVLDGLPNIHQEKLEASALFFR